MEEAQAHLFGAVFGASDRVLAPYMHPIHVREPWRHVVPGRREVGAAKSEVICPGGKRMVWRLGEDVIEPGVRQAFRQGGPHLEGDGAYGTCAHCEHVLCEEVLLAADGDLGG